jgi:NAD-dependent SIR2 family protein deacetylase
MKTRENVTPPQSRDVLDPEIVNRCCDLIREADGILIGAGAGLSADAGLDYTDTARFARLFPAMVKRGFRMQAELIGYTGWSPAVQWGYFAIHVNEMRFKAPPHPVYGRLLDLVRNKDYFVMTSNVDEMFVKNGFEEERVFTPQGSYALMQCLKPCTNTTWPTKPIISRILPNIDPDTQEVTDPEVIPRCPNCGGPVFMNVRGGDWFLEDPYVEQAERFSEWVRRKRGRLLALEIGAGFNTPSVIRWPIERVVHFHPEAHLIRVNLQWPQVPKEIAHRSLSSQCSAMKAVTALWAAMGMGGEGKRSDQSSVIS